MNLSLSKPRRRALLPGVLCAVAGVAAACQSSHDSLRAGALNARYGIEGMDISLGNGAAVSPVEPGSAGTVKTRVFGTPAFGDLDGDGDDDAVLWLVQDPGGSGIYWYVAAAINDNDSVRGTEAAFLGDRIAPVNLLIAGRVVTAHFKDRRPEEPASAEPSVVVVNRYTAAGDGLVPVTERAAGNTKAH